MRVGLLPITLAAVSATGCAETATRTYVARLSESSVTLAWGQTDGASGRNTIGMAAEPAGTARVLFGGREYQASNRSWLEVNQLQPDTTYPYQIQLGGRTIAEGSVRTWPSSATSLTFFAIGDFGNGSSNQLAVAQRMEEERQRLESRGESVRFVLSLGDNIYGRLSASGSNDRDWDRKFFAPYARTLAAIPFLAVPGNHDGNESERTADLPVYLDNFFQSSRWYRFSFGGLAEFICLDSTRNQLDGTKTPAYRKDGEQTAWLAQQLARPAARWRIAVVHHPMFTAGPEHPPFREQAPHWFSMFRDGSVRAVFSGHEHNLQFSERNAATGGIQFIVSGAGGELRDSPVRSRMAERQIAAWAAQPHFLVVRVNAEAMQITPVSVSPLQLINPVGSPVPVPVVVPWTAPAAATESEKGTSANPEQAGALPDAGRKRYDPSSIHLGLGAILPKGQQFQPLTGTERMRLWKRQMFLNPNLYIRTTLWAARDQASAGPGDPWSSGAAGFAERFGSRYSRSAMSTSIRHGLAAAAQYDLRYVASTRSNPLLRALHALTWDFRTLNREGKPVVNWPRFAAVYGSELISATYTPGRKWSAYGIQSANEQIVFGGVTDLLREFLPELKRLFRRSKVDQNRRTVTPNSAPGGSRP